MKKSAKRSTAKSHYIIAYQCKPEDPQDTDFFEYQRVEDALEKAYTDAVDGTGVYVYKAIRLVKKDTPPIKVITLG